MTLVMDDDIGVCVLLTEDNVGVCVLLTDDDIGVCVLLTDVDIGVFVSVYSCCRRTTRLVCVLFKDDDISVCMLLTDDAVRNELMEQLPVIVHLCHTITELNTLGRFLPIIVRYLTDASSQVDVHSV